MQRNKICSILGTIMVGLLFFGVFVTITIDTSFGTIEVKTISILNEDLKLSGLLYKPKTAVAENPAAAVVLAHGISGSKEMVSGIGLELSRRGFVALCLDLYGHGKSQGAVNLGQTDTSFGVSSAVQYLKSQTFVNSSALGLIGHSLGAGAMRAVVAEDEKIGALVLVGGGLGDFIEDSQYAIFNSTYPRNLLVIIGKYDVLFNLTKLAKEDLPVVFGTQQEVVPDTIYGSFSSQTARKFVIPATTHLFEPIESSVVSESIAWMENTFNIQDSSDYVGNGQVYLFREATIAVALVGLLGIAFLSLNLIERLIQAKPPNGFGKTKKTTVKKSRSYAIWGVINIALLIPMFGLGLVITFPPLIFGSSVAWWMLTSGTIGILLITKFSKRTIGEKIKLKEKITDGYSKNGLVMTILLFIILISITTTLALGFNFNFRIITPIFRDFSSVYRILMFFIFVPFFFPYFISEGLYLHELAQEKPITKENRYCLRNYLVTIFAKSAPFIFLLFLQYAPKIAFDIWILPSFIGFLLEFLWLLIPIFLIASSFSWWFHKRTGNIIYGALFNALLMSWIASTVFPF